jgi:tRNA pseudouridine13 synthase
MCSATPSLRAPLSNLIDFQSLPYARSEPTVKGVIRISAEDFRVSEDLAFPLTGSGEHLYLRIRKTGQNTRWVGRQLANQLGLPVQAVGYAGLKDRHAIADQWFSAHLPGRADPDPGELNIDGVEILELKRHSGKLRIGALTGNRFRIVIRYLEGDIDALDTTLTRVRDASIPNYFGPQRFGRGGRNLTLLTQGPPTRKTSKAERSFGLSALRSALFNGYLAERLRDGSWGRLMPGEIGYCAATGRYHRVDSYEGPHDSLQPTGLLWGAGENQATDRALTVESEFFAGYSEVTSVLADYDVRTMRRPLGLLAQDLVGTLQDDALVLEFGLQRGQFATAVLREIVTFADAGQ